MAVVYRSEKKLILRSQVNLIQKIIQILNNCEKILTDKEDPNVGSTYTKFILQETPSETI